MGAERTATGRATRAAERGWRIRHHSTPDPNLLSPLPRLQPDQLSVWGYFWPSAAGVVLPELGRGYPSVDEGVRARRNCSSMKAASAHSVEYLNVPTIDHQASGGSTSIFQRDDGIAVVKCRCKWKTTASTKASCALPTIFRARWWGPLAGFPVVR